MATWDYRPTIVVDNESVQAESVMKLVSHAVESHEEWIDLATVSSEAAARRSIADAITELRKHDVPVSGAYIVAVEFENDTPTGRNRDISVHVS